MNNYYLKKLEFYKILEILENFCSTISGKEIALNLLPSNDKELVIRILTETEEAISLSYRNSFPSFYDFYDITTDIKILESGTSLSTKSLLNLAYILKNAEDLRNYFNKDFLDKSSYPILSEYFEALYSNKSISDRILSCILDESTIDDNASKTLNTIRRKSRNLEQDIRNKLNDMIHSSKYSKIIQENIITIRNDRFVIPIKEEYRGQIKGFIHDISNAGSTVFIEPISIFEMNNELNRLKLDEELEIEKILYELSSLLIPYIKELVNNTLVIRKIRLYICKSKIF